MHGSIGGFVISESYDLDRLERAVRSLVDRCHDLVQENTRLRGELEERESRVRVLDDELLQMNQRRQDAAKRIDDLIAQIDQIDARLGQAEGRAVGLDSEAVPALRAD